MIQSESLMDITSIHMCKLHPTMKKQVICRSPFCGYYRQLCKTCVLLDQQHAEKYHLNIQKALTYVENKAKQIQKSLLILKRQKQEKLKSNPITLPYEIKQKLESIRQIINQKISLFEKSLQQRYEKEVNAKLQNLQETIKKSLDFIRKQINDLESLKYLEFDLKKFFLNFQYWQHERKYYKSYIQQILQKQIKNFKQGLDDDNIMKLIVGFQLNLKSIFSPNKLSLNNQLIHLPHLFYQDKHQIKKYEVIQNNNHLSIEAQFINNNYPKQNYKWQGIPQSVYSPQLDCFYIFGEGDKASNSIVRYQDERYNHNRKFTFVGQMLTKRAYFSLTIVNGEIFIIGGYNPKQGCMNKCQKMIVNQKIKLFFVSSLQQRSACHSVCNYKNKYILKFGGTSVILSQKQRFYGQNQIKQLYPQIYDIQKQQWRIIRYNIYGNKQRLQFGLWPTVIISNYNDQGKIIVFGNKPLQKKYDKISNRNNENKKIKFQIKLILTKNQIQMKIRQTFHLLNRKYFMVPQTAYLNQKNSCTQVIAKDTHKNQNSFFLLKLQN